MIHERLGRRSIAVGLVTLLSASMATANSFADSTTQAAAPGASVAVAPGVRLANQGRYVTTEFSLQSGLAEIPRFEAVIAFGDAKPDPTTTAPHAYADHQTLATSDVVGAVYGVAVTTGNPAAPISAGRAARTFVGAYLKAQTRFGTGGPGAIYSRDAAGSVAEFARIPNAGGPADRLGGLHANVWNDPQVNVGKRSLGDIDIDANEHYLYAVNLNDRNVYRVDTWADDAAARTASIVNIGRPTGHCATADDLRPFALELSGSTLYLGAMCSGETSGKQADVHGEVWAYDLAAGTWAAAPVVRADGFPGGGFVPWKADATATSPTLQMMLTDLDIATDGTMLLGFRARHGDMIAATSPQAVPTSNGIVTLARPAGAGTWSDPAITDPFAGQTAPGLAADQDGYFSTVGVDQAGFTPQGSVAITPSLSTDGLSWTLATTQRNPFAATSLGVTFFNATGGASFGREEIMRRDGSNHALGKSSGIGDLEAMSSWRIIGNRVWTDSNGNGIQDDGEAGLSGVTLNLKATCSSNDTVATVTSGADGTFQFVVEPFAAYAIVPDPSNLTDGGVLYGTRMTRQVAGQPEADSNARPDGCVEVAAGHREQIDNSYDIGVLSITPPASFAVGDRAWFDTNRDGVQDAGEPGAAGVTVELLSGGSVQRTTVTDAAGLYLFDGLAAGTFTIRFSNLAAGVAFSPTGAGAAATDSNANPTTGITLPFTLGEATPLVTAADRSDLATIAANLAATRIDRTIDAGTFRPMFAIGDWVWFDTDRDGTQDDGELGAAGIKVELVTSGGDVADTAVTDAAGRYLFDNVLTGQYRVRFSDLPAGYQFSPSGNGSSTTDSDATADGRTVIFTVDASAPVVTDADRADFPTLAATRIIRAIDAGISTPTPAPTFSVGNRVWRDLDNDGIMDTTEVGIDGVVVTLVDEAGSVKATAETNDGGYYRFDGVDAGPYRVVVTELNFQAGKPLYGATSSATDETDPNADIDRNDNGAGARVAGVGVQSGPVVVGPTEVTGETDLAATGQGTEDNRANMTIDFGFVPGFDVAIDKTLVTPTLSNGSTAQYTIAVANDSLVAVGPMTVRDVAPAGLTFTSIDAPGWDCTLKPGELTCVLDGPLGAGQQSTMTLQARVGIANGSLDNTACVTTPLGGGLVATNDCDVAAGRVVTAAVSPGALPRTGAGSLLGMFLWAQTIVAFGAWMVSMSRTGSTGRPTSV